MKAIQEVLRLHAAGLSQRQIARACGLSKGAVGKYLQRAMEAQVVWPLPEGMEVLALQRLLQPARLPVDTGLVTPNFAMIHVEMRRKGMTLQLLWEEYVAGHEGQKAYHYTRFCTLYRAWNDRLKRSMRQNHVAGEKLFIDYAGPTVPVVDPGTGEIRTAQIFVAVLGASSYTYCEATWSQNLSDFLGSHVRALRYLGGVPVLLVPDNLKAAVTKASRYEPEINRSCQDLATHYGAVVLPTRPYKPQDKAKVEVGVQVVERWILAHLRLFQFFSLMDLNREIRRLLEDLNQRPFKQLPGSRKSTFEALDRPALKPLPAQDYVFAVWKTAKVSIDYHQQRQIHPATGTGPDTGDTSKGGSTARSRQYPRTPLLPLNRKKNRMLQQPTLNALRQLNLHAMAEALDEQSRLTQIQDLSFDERLGLLLDRELCARDQRRLTRLLKLAHLKQNACVEDIDYRGSRGLDRSKVMALIQNTWIRQGHNLLITGATGTGKTWLGCALGHQACRQGLCVRYLRLPRLFEELRIRHGDGSFGRYLTTLAKVDLLILDDWGLAPMNAEDVRDLLEIIDDRVNQRATLITSQLPVNHWHEYLGEPTVADAVLDRLLQSAHRLELKGDSLRRHSDGRDTPKVDAS
jgi:transposase/DNA replication protein DnaC